MHKILTYVANNRYLGLASGTILLVTAGVEIIQSFGEESVGAHHGVALYGLIQIIKSLPEIFFGVRDVVEDEK